MCFLVDLFSHTRAHKITLAANTRAHQIYLAKILQIKNALKWYDSSIGCVSFRFNSVCYWRAYIHMYSLETVVVIVGKLIVVEVWCIRSLVLKWKALCNRSQSVILSVNKIVFISFKLTFVSELCNLCIENHGWFFSLAQYTIIRTINFKLFLLFSHR